MASVSVEQNTDNSVGFEFGFSYSISTSDDPNTAGQPSDILIGGGLDLVVIEAIEIGLTVFKPPPTPTAQPTVSFAPTASFPSPEPMPVPTSTPTITQCSNTCLGSSCDTLIQNGFAQTCNDKYFSALDCDCTGCCAPQPSPTSPPSPPPTSSPVPAPSPNPTFTFPPTMTPNPTVNFYNSSTSTSSVCVSGWRTYQWLPDRVTTYVLSVHQIEQLIRLLDFARKRQGDDVARAVGLSEQIENWRTILKNYRAHTSSQSLDVASYLGDIIGDLHETFAAFKEGVVAPETQQYAMSDFQEYLDSGIKQLHAKMNPRNALQTNSQATRNKLRERLRSLEPAIQKKQALCDSTDSSSTNVVRQSCEHFRDLESHAILVDNLLGICETFLPVQDENDDHEDGDDAATASMGTRFKKFCQPGSAGDQSVSMFDALEDDTHYITFSGGAGISMEFTSSVQDSRNVDVDIAVDKEGSSSQTGSAGFGIGMFSASIEMAGIQSESVSVSMGKSAGEDREREHTVQITLGDYQSDDYFAMKIEQDKVYGTPIFTTLGGRSSCPGETATTRRDSLVTISGVKHRCGNDFESLCNEHSLVYGQDALIGVQIQNLNPFMTNVFYELSIDDSTPADPFVTDQLGECGKVDGLKHGVTVELAGRGPLGQELGPMPYGEWEALLRVQKGPICDEYNNLQLNLVASCEAWSPDSIDVYQYATAADATTGEITVIHPEYDFSSGDWKDGTAARGPEQPDYYPFSVNWKPFSPSPLPSSSPTKKPSPLPSPAPSPAPSPFPTYPPSPLPTPFPTYPPSPLPSNSPTPMPSPFPTQLPSLLPTPVPSPAPTRTPVVVLQTLVSNCSCADFNMTVFNAALGSVVQGATFDDGACDNSTTTLFGGLQVIIITMQVTVPRAVVTDGEWTDAAHYVNTLMRTSISDGTLQEEIEKRRSVTRRRRLDMSSLSLLSASADTVMPTPAPSPIPTTPPPSATPTATPTTNSPTRFPSNTPTAPPTQMPTLLPSATPTADPTTMPTTSASPTQTPTLSPSSKSPSTKPTIQPNATALSAQKETQLKIKTTSLSPSVFIFMAFAWFASNAVLSIMSYRVGRWHGRHSQQKDDPPDDTRLSTVFHQSNPMAEATHAERTLDRPPAPHQHHHAASPRHHPAQHCRDVITYD